MARGGKREGAGGQFKWKHGRTKLVRVPEVLVEQILDYARQLDADGIIEHETQSKLLDLSGISIRHHEGAIAVRLEDLVKAGYQIRPEKIAQLVEARIQKLLIDKQLKYGNNPQKRE